MANQRKPATLGERLKWAREQSGLSATQVANRLGVKSQSVSAWEGDQREPRANKLLMLAGILNVSVAWLLEGSGKGPQERSIELELEEIAGRLESARSQVDKLSRQLDRATGKIDKLLERVRAARQQAAE
ncbi:MAG: helix-turn-helix domain-containing protein [Rhodovibrionaceae bacterium]|nr:helix-turn-helix domain-containing protein [Rhodovibrionaceae bacterium]